MHPPPEQRIEGVEAVSSPVFRKETVVSRPACFALERFGSKRILGLASPSFFFAGES